MKLEEKKFPRKLKGIAKGLEISGFGIVEYYVRSESGCMIALWAQSYYVPGSPKDLHIIYLQVIHTSEGYKGNFIAHCNDEHYGYAELNLKEDNPGWQNAEPVERVIIKYEPKENLPTHEATLTNHIEKEVKALESDICVTNEANQNTTPSQKELFQWHFRLGHIGFQYVQWLICTWRLKVQVNSNAVANFESPKCAACEFGKGNCQPNKVNTINKNSMKEQEIKKYHILPGQMVSADNYFLRDPGRIYHTKGK